MYILFSFLLVCYVTVVTVLLFDTVTHVELRVVFFVTMYATSDTYWFWWIEYGREVEIGFCCQLNVQFVRYVEWANVVTIA